MTQRPPFPLILVLMLAAVLRFGFFGVNTFAFDEARLSLIALRTARAGEFATVGMPSSAGVPNMPAAAWVFALPYAITPNPALATATVSLFALLAVFGVWRLARPWGRRAAFVAALFVAAHPFAVLYGRSIWAQNLLVPLAVLWLMAAVGSIQHGPRRNLWAGVFAFISGFALQVHFAGAALALAAIYAGLRWRLWRQWPGLLVGGGLAIACALPFMLTPGALSGLLATAGGASTIDAAAWRDAARLLAGWDWAFLLHGEAELPLARLTPGMVRAGLGAVLVLFVGLMGLFGAAALLKLEPAAPPDTAPTSPAPMPRSPLLELALVLLLAAPVLFTRHSTPVFIHYLLTMLPGAALMLGWLARDGAPALLRRLTTALVVFVALVWSAGMLRAFAYTGHTLTPNGMPTPLRTLQAAAAAPAMPVVYHTFGNDPNFEGEPAIFSVLWWGDEARIIDGRTVLVLPPYPASLMFTERAFPAWEDMRESDLLGDAVQVPRREGAPAWELAPYDGETAPAGFTLLDAPVAFEHGGVLRGWRVYEVGPRTRVSTLWAAPGPIGGSVQQFHHLRTDETPDGPPAFGADVSVRGAHWRSGDTVIVMGDFIELPRGVEYTLEVGQYTLPDVVRIPNSQGDVVRLGPFRLE